MHKAFEMVDMLNQIPSSHMATRLDGCPPWCVTVHAGEASGSPGDQARRHSRTVMETHEGEVSGTGVEIVSLEHLDQPDESAPAEVVLSARDPLNLADAGYLATSIMKAVTLAGQTHRPYWLKRACPPWCNATHLDGDHLDDRIHWPDDSPPVLLSLHNSVSTAGESCRDQAYRPQRLEVDLEQHADAVEPVVKFVIEGATAALRLTLDEAEQVQMAVGQVVAMARDADSQPIGAAPALSAPARTPERPSLDRTLVDRVIHDEGLTAGQKISVLRGGLAAHFTEQGLSTAEQAARLNCTEEQAVDAVVDFAMWSHAGYLLPPARPAEPQCPVWCAGNCRSEGGVRLHDRHVAAVYGQHSDDANEPKVATVDLEAFNSPDGYGDEPPSVTLAIDNPQQRTADMTKLDGLDHGTVRSLAASLLSGCWDRTTIRLTPQKAAELGASLITASRAAYNNTAVKA
ncbi:hypothetical protein DKT69_24895 [Micromonospora sicca]|uniref:Uncharacterized protein n=1 Tax=Micromonospora sicca TaxID=2202420 RepID=A0A317DBJ3_9ACTN|nr:hypothetical protein [Micromonospora sp. 4G51]PWR12139.1 hypothetical protein DKT69_24895 [Micromonospora sp. 4G51]